MPLVECRTLFNQKRLVSSETMIHRPSVYGVVVHADRVLLAKARSTQKYVLPGGGIELGEATDDALKREVWEETGIRIEVGDFLHFQTDFFYYDPMALAIHGFLFYYHCTPLTTELDPPEYPPEEDLEFPIWVATAELCSDDFQGHGEVIMPLIQACLTRE